MSVSLLNYFVITICASLNMCISTLDLEHQYGNINDFF